MPLIILNAMNKRADQILVDLGLFESRSKAQSAIDEGLVFFQGKVIEKPSTNIVSGARAQDFEVQAGAANRFVSRGGLKLEGALKTIKLDVRNFEVLDVGISTGGFTDCLLQAGVRFVVGVDVGSGQIHSKISKKQNVEIFENTHIKDFKADRKFDLVVVDVSFISLRNVLPFITPRMKRQGHLLALVKPQFELDAKKLGKGGIVKDSTQFEKIESDLKTFVQELELTVLGYFESPISGKDGNKEFFIYASKNLNNNHSS